MAIEDISTAGQSTKDNIGRRDSTKDQILFRNKEQIFVEEGATVIQTRSLGSSFVLGHPSNGILGTSLLGDGTAGAWTTQTVTNPNDTWHEHFRDSFFEDSTNSNGATWDTTNFRLEMTSGADARTINIFDNNEEIASVKVDIEFTGVATEFIIDVDANPGGQEVNLS